MDTDFQLVVLVKEEVPDKQSAGVDQQDPEHLHIKEEQKELWTSLEGEQLHLKEETDGDRFPFTVVTIKSEDDEEKPLFSQLHQQLIEDRDVPTSSSDDQMTAETSRNPDLNSHEQTFDSPEIEVSVDDEEDDDMNPYSELSDSGSETGDDDDDWNESSVRESSDEEPPTIISRRCPKRDAAGNALHHQDAWKTESDPDTVNPRPPRFIPRRTPGYQFPITTSLPTPADLFNTFFDAQLLKLLCSNTNKYANKRMESRKNLVWNDITPQELQTYLGLLLFMSVCDLPKRDDFWRKNSIFHVSFPASVMSRDRFRAIAWNIHLSDPQEDLANEQRKGTEEYDSLQKVRALLEEIRTRCKLVYHPQQHISVDERMVATKARLTLKQCMKAKPTKWGLKFFVLADVKGYTVDFQLYTGKSHTASGNGLSFDVVSQLVNKNFLGSGYIVYCDNFYTSPLLFRHLSQQGFGACGTCRQGRVGVPKTQENALDKKSPRGSIRWIRDGDLLFVKWKDTREVSMITTVHPVHSGETVLRWQKSDGECRRVSIPRPTAVGEYNKYMGGVDTSDQMLQTNTVHRRTRRWPVTVFQHCLDIAVTNSYIIHKHICNKHQKQAMTRQQFQEKLCAQLLGVDENPPVTSTKGHIPVSCNSGEGMDKAQRASQGRKRCTLCKRSTPWMCKACSKGLCLQLDRNCFAEYHSS